MNIIMLLMQNLTMQDDELKLNLTQYINSSTDMSEINGYDAWFKNYFDHLQN